MALVFRQYHQPTNLSRRGDRYILVSWPMCPCTVDNRSGGIRRAQIKGKNPRSIKTLDRLPPVAEQSGFRGRSFALGLGYSG